MEPGQLLALIEPLVWLVPDEAQPDCNRNSVPDSHEVATGQAGDCDGDGVLDACDIALPAFDLSVIRREVESQPRQIVAADIDANGLEDLVFITTIFAKTLSGSPRLATAILATFIAPSASSAGAAASPRGTLSSGPTDSRSPLPQPGPSSVNLPGRYSRAVRISR